MAEPIVPPYLGKDLIFFFEDGLVDNPYIIRLKEGQTNISKSAFHYMKTSLMTKKRDNEQLCYIQH